MGKIAFYLDNRHISQVDCSAILQGNPGIGGTEYMIMAVSYLLAIRNNGLKIKTYVRSQGIFPKEYNYETVDSFVDAVNRASTDGYDYCIFKHEADLISSGALDAVDKNIKLIVWDHVFACYWELDYYAKNPQIYRIVNVGREMNDLYRDHRVFEKSLFIYNGIDLDGVREQVEKHPFDKRGNNVVYVGALVPFKGFHLLAAAWPEILKKVPDAELYVIGSGKLYDSNAEMGRFGIAERSYEDLFMRYLSKNDEIIPSVHFMGNMGHDKNDILLQAKVGVPNPSGITETFCISAVEMQVMGELVTTINYPGFMDTIKNGILYRNKKNLAKNVVRLLKSANRNYEETMNFFEKNFSFDAVVREWEMLLCNRICGREEKISNPFYRMKWMKELKRILGKKYPIFYKLPPIERILLFLERLYKGPFTYIDSGC